MPIPPRPPEPPSHDPAHASAPDARRRTPGASADPAVQRGLRAGDTTRALRARAEAAYRQRPPLTFADYPALLDALLPDDDAGEADVAWVARTSVGALHVLRAGLGAEAGGGEAGAPPEVLVRLARLVALDLDTLQVLVRRDLAPHRADEVAQAVAHAWAEVPV